MISIGIRTSAYKGTTGRSNHGVNAVDAIERHCVDLREVLAAFFDIDFRNIASACKDMKILSPSNYDVIFDSHTHDPSAVRVEKFLQFIKPIFKFAPEQLDVFLCILQDSGNIAICNIAEMIAKT